MTSELEIPAPIEAVLQTFEQSTEPFTAMDVQQALADARRFLKDELSDAEQFGTWSEVLAFSLVEGRDYPGAGPWGTYFCPMGSGTDKEGKTFYFPDIAEANAAVVGNWEQRARTLEHPILKARYADLVWDLSPAIAGGRRDPKMALIAIDAYLATLPLQGQMHDRLTAAVRALDVASLIRDAERIVVARTVLLKLHHEVMKTKDGQWGVAFDRLINDKHTNVSDAERGQLVADLEELVLYYGNTANPQHFNPHDLQQAANRLIKQYARLRRPDEVKRLQVAVGRAFEHFASLGDAMVAAAVLQTAVSAYRDAGLPDESRRVRILMEEKIGQSRDEMATIETKVEIPADNVEKALNSLVEGDLASAFARMAASFLPRKTHLEEAVAESLKKAPLMALMPHRILAEDHVAGVVGAVPDDPLGRLLQRASMDLQFNGVWLQGALEKLIEVHNPAPEHFAGWANRHGLFDDTTLLLEGVRAWYELDLTKAIHVLVPQVEAGLRAIVGQLGNPITKPHPVIPGVGIAINMGDILYSEMITSSLGPDITLYLLALYADPRALNLRNRVAHGQLEVSSMQLLVPLLIHTLLLFGVWKELAEAQR